MARWIDEKKKKLNKKNDANLDKYCELLRQLSNRIYQGNGNDGESEKIRDEMDYYWNNLSEFDKMLARSLATQLNNHAEETGKDG